jgi:hypothetical protein
MFHMTRSAGINWKRTNKEICHSRLWTSSERWVSTACIWLCVSDHKSLNIKKVSCSYTKNFFEIRFPWETISHSVTEVLYTISWNVLAVSFLLAFPSKPYMHSFSLHTCYMPHPSRPTRCVAIILLDLKYKFWSSSLRSFLLPAVISPVFRYILLANSFSNTSNPCFFPNIRHQVSHSYKTRINVIVLYILMF